MQTADEILKDKHNVIISVPSETTVLDALKVMNEKKIGAILATEGKKIVGIWTERDLMQDITEEGFDPRRVRIREVMTRELISAPHSDPVYRLLDKFLGLRLRHLLIEKEGEYIGLLSWGDVIKAYLNEKQHELRELNAMVSWEYYENWRWKRR